MVHAITWISVAVLVLAFIFFIVSVIILEYGVKVDQSGDIIIPWYYWVFFVGAGLLFLAYAILLAFPDKSVDKEKTYKSDTPESWVQGNVLYTEYGKKAQNIPGSEEQDPARIREHAAGSPHYDMSGKIISPYTHHSHYTHGPTSFASHDTGRSSASFASHDAGRAPFKGSSLHTLSRRSYLE